MSNTFRELLRNTTGSVERPKALAEGHYIGTIRAHEFGQSARKQTPFVRLLLVPSEETEDVAEGANAGITLANQELRVDYYITAKSLYRIGDMLDGVLGADPNRAFDERLPEVNGARVMFGVTQRESDRTDSDGTPIVFNDVTTIVAAD